MKECVVIVIGLGWGVNIVYEALANNLNIALVDKSQRGGTYVRLREKKYKP